MSFADDDVAISLICMKATCLIVLIVLLTASISGCLEDDTTSNVTITVTEASSIVIQN